MKIVSKKQFRQVTWYIVYKRKEYSVIWQEDLVEDTWTVTHIDEDNGEIEEYVFGDPLYKKLVIFCQEDLDKSC